MSWSQEQVKALINEYKKHTCLYQIKSMNYTNRSARNAAFESIIDGLSPLKKATLNDIKAKFQALRSNYIKEERKHVESLKTATCADEIYHPTIWYYKSMRDFDFDMDPSIKQAISMDVGNEQPIEFREIKQVQSPPPEEIFFDKSSTFQSVSQAPDPLTQDLLGDEIDGFLQFLKAKLTRIKDDVILSRTEMAILAIVDKAIAENKLLI